MSTARGKAPLGTGTTIKTRKRNVVHKHDPETFRDKIVEILANVAASPADAPLSSAQTAPSPAQTSQDADPAVPLSAEGLQESLGALHIAPAAVDATPAAFLHPKKLLQAFDSESLDFSRYGETFTEILFAGNIVEPGGSLRGAPTPHCIFQCKNDDATLPIVALLHQLLRRKPFLRPRYDAAAEKLVAYITNYSADQRQRFAFAVGTMIHQSMLSASIMKKLCAAALQLPCPPLIESGAAIQFFVAVAKALMAQNGNQVDKLMNILKNANIDMDAILSLMPTAKRTPDDLSQFFKDAGLEVLVSQNEKRAKTKLLQALKQGISERITSNTPPPQIWEWIQSFLDADVKQANCAVAKPELVACVWDGMIESTDLSKKSQQKRQLILTCIKANAVLLFNVCKSGADEMELLNSIQSFISADMDLLKISAFRDIVNLLYQVDVLSEDTILKWHRTSTVSKGSAASSNIIREQMNPFIKWLETADEDEEE